MASDGLQGALLTVLDDSSVRRLGEERVRPVDVRIVAATNEDLEQRVLEGEFRRDLLGRFGFFRLEIPSLSARRDDILPLFRLFLAKELRDRGERKPVEVNPEVEEVLRAAAWPDNVRELLNVARYVVAVRDPGEALSVDQLPAQTLRSSTATGAEWSAQLAATLRRVGGNRSKAAKLLGVGRATLYRRQASQSPESG
jgi:transcriptional regulator of acetoin/glycerol metabolism